MLNGEKYKELCPDNTLLSVIAIRSCIISHHQRALLRRDGMADTELHVFLPLEVRQGASIPLGAVCRTSAYGLHVGSDGSMWLLTVA